MGNWLALLVAPTLALADLAITYALTTPACSRQSQLSPNLVSAAILLACVLFTALAWRNWLAQAGVAASLPADAAAARRRFMALVSGLVGALSCLVVVALWLPQWMLSPCAN